uniref:Uncharacterized protein n=1 Tax=Siphoviridae sp. ctwQg18 TaxID=2826516 RepID=A0A8S5MIZ6_9CAUD|nr:MAG TPA: hypothetical protein [Siphoviridae sp. ctwQg18]DAD82203.1 MAG TPA: hypothetical protein [Siphoviridae sp. ctwQg18]
MCYSDACPGRLLGIEHLENASHRRSVNLV